ncbi:MAG: hypothetical protein JST22_01550 [Bacteroidetes bacterium]|nr:hypothetical protein [Bacteroidota bacterium]
MKPLHTALAVAAAATLLSCSTASGPDWNAVVIAHPLAISLTSEQHVALNGNDTAYTESVTALFRDPARGDTSAPVPVTGVQLNGTAIPMSGTYYADTAASPVLSMAHGGGFNRWHVDGLGTIPTFSDSIPALATWLHLRSPHAADTISLSRGLLMTWDTAGRRNGSQIAFGILGTMLHGTDSITSGMFYLLADNGAFAIAPEGLAAQGWLPGTATITLQRYLNRDTLTPNRVRYRITETQTIELHTTFAP